MSFTQKVIYLAQPSYAGAIHPDVYKSLFLQASRMHKTIPHAMGGCSLLAHAFNTLWCVALNRRTIGTPKVTHFAMLHADIGCESWWLDKLAHEMDITGADVVSAVVPIKSPHGVTSTAIPLSPDDPWSVEKRLTIHECKNELPETFCAADIGYPGRALLINSGCWLARMDTDWCEKICFTVNDKIVRRESDGVWEPLVESEDWNFGRQLHALGCKVYATTKISLKHYGLYGYPSHHGGDWGQWKHDDQTSSRGLQIKELIPISHHPV